MAPARLALLLSATLLSAATPDDQDWWEHPASGPLPIELPPGPAAEAWSAAPADVRAADLGAPWPAPGDPAWRTAVPWERWSEELAAAAGDDAERALLARGRLARLAAIQGRAAAAWEHLVACGERPDYWAAALPLLLPGTHGASGGGGLPSPLAPGAVLHPLLPPSNPELEAGVWERRRWVLRGLRVGETELAMRLSLEPDGVQVDLRHLSGPPTSVRVVIPSPPELEMRIEYADWMRLDTVGEPIEIQLAPGDDTHTLWGRALPLRVTWPAELPRELSRKLSTGGIAVEIGPDDPERARLAELTDALGRVLAIPTRLRVTGEPLDASGPGRVVVRLHEGPVRERKLRALLDATERFVLRR